MKCASCGLLRFYQNISGWQKKYSHFLRKKKKKNFTLDFLSLNANVSVPSCLMWCWRRRQCLQFDPTRCHICFINLQSCLKKKKKSFYWPIKLMGHCKVFNYLSQLVLLIMRHDLGVWGGGFFSVFPIATVISFWNPKLVIQLLYIVWKTKLTCVMLVLMIN